MLSINKTISNNLRSKISTIKVKIFSDYVKKIKSNYKLKVLSISTGCGFWDYLFFKHNKRIKKIIATDIIDSPIYLEDIRRLKAKGNWSFVKVKAEKNLPFKSETFDVVYHMDVIEHVSKPYLFLSEQYRVLKKGGKLIIGTPNLFRPANIVKLFLGKLYFPNCLGSDKELGQYVHIQEFSYQQMTILLKEIGFTEIQTTYCYFGIHYLNVCFTYLPKNNIGQSLCHFLFFYCVK